MPKKVKLYLHTVLTLVASIKADSREDSLDWLLVNHPNLFQLTHKDSAPKDGSIPELILAGGSKFQSAFTCKDVHLGFKNRKDVLAQMVLKFLHNKWHKVQAASSKIAVSEPDAPNHEVPFLVASQSELDKLLADCYQSGNEHVQMFE